MMATFSFSLDDVSSVYFLNRCEELDITPAFAAREALTHAGMIPRRTKDLVHKAQGEMASLLPRVRENAGQTFRRRPRRPSKE